MRLSDFERQIICEAVSKYDPRAKTYLFGSRVNDDFKGGDIDLLCLSDQITRVEKRKIKRDILDRIGQQQLDLVIDSSNNNPFVACIMSKAQRLG